VPTGLAAPFRWPLPGEPLAVKVCVFVAVIAALVAGTAWPGSDETAGGSTQIAANASTVPTR